MSHKRRFREHRDLDRNRDRWSRDWRGPSDYRGIGGYGGAEAYGGGAEFGSEPGFGYERDRHGSERERSRNYYGNRYGRSDEERFGRSMDEGSYGYGRGGYHDEDFGGSGFGGRGFAGRRDEDFFDEPRQGERWSRSERDWEQGLERGLRSGWTDRGPGMLGEQAIMGSRGYGYGQRGRSGSRFGEGGYQGESDWRGQGRDWEQYRNRRPKNYKRSDERIREDVCDRLSQRFDLDPSELEVSVHNGEVTLSGNVSRRIERRLAEDCAENVAGVSHVQNNLRVKEQASSSRDEEQESRYSGSSSAYARQRP